MTSTVDVLDIRALLFVFVECENDAAESLKSRDRPVPIAPVRWIPMSTRVLVRGMRYPSIVEGILGTTQGTVLRRVPIIDGQTSEHRRTAPCTSLLPPCRHAIGIIGICIV